MADYGGDSDDGAGIVGATSNRYEHSVDNKTLHHARNHRFLDHPWAMYYWRSFSETPQNTVAVCYTGQQQY